eukprot:scaffold9857_cov195-Amphora_coffeaeformis.AAC.9
MAVETTTTDSNEQDNDNEGGMVDDGLGLTDWLTLSEQIATALETKTHVQSFWQANTRPDGRAWTQVRPTTIVPSVLRTNINGNRDKTSPHENSSSSPSSSALVRLGKTHVMGAVSWNIGQTTPSSSSSSAQGGSATASATATAATSPSEQGDVPPCIPPYRVMFNAS